ncbi:MAG: DUF2059 domain-containing protein [Gemmatimonadota bacterium]
MRLFPALALAATLGFTGTARAQQIDSAKAALIRRIIDVTHMGEQMILAIEASVPDQRAANPRIPSVFWDRFLERANSRKQELLGEMVPIYAKIFTARELEQLLQFWQSGIGQRFIELQPRLTQDVMTAARDWGGRLGAEIAQELQAEGVEIKP